ncbi:MAG: amidohydrolase family protein [Planctomycetes bacterium]|nr:amidohydrolase family protein [Planctomycetota bacterium]
MRVLALLIALSLQASPQPKASVLKGAKVYPGSGAPIENASIVIENGKIVAVGKDLPLPADATVIDATGKVIIPGLIDAASRLFIPPGERSPGSAEQNVLDALDLYQRDYREAVEQGVTAAYVGPLSLGSVNGLGAVLRLDGTRTILLKDAALKLTLGASGGETSTALERYQSYPQLKQAFEAARQYVEGWEKFRKDLAEYEQKKAKKEEAKEPAKPKVEPRHEVLARALDPKGTLKVRIEVHSADAIALALRLAADFKLRAVLEQATEGGACAVEIAKSKIPVVAGPVFRLGGYSVDYLNHSTATAAALVAAGVPLAIGSFGDERAGHWGVGASRFLAEAAAVAASRGLTREQALAAITLDAAKILGIDKTQGSIEKGKAADLVVLSGEPFETGTRVEKTLIDGVVVHERGAR